MGNFKNVASLEQAGLLAAYLCKHGAGRNNARTAMKLSFYSLRHTAVSLLKTAGMPDAVVMVLVAMKARPLATLHSHCQRSALPRYSNRFPEI